MLKCLKVWNYPILKDYDLLWNLTLVKMTQVIMIKGNWIKNIICAFYNNFLWMIIITINTFWGIQSQLLDLS